MKLLKRLILLMLPLTAQAQQYKPTWESLDSRPVPAWFENAKFGIFIHWGVYAVPAWSPKGVYSEWYQYWLQSRSVFGNNNPSPTAVFDHHNRVWGKDFSYYQFADHFKAEDYDPDAWAKLFEKSGAKYIVLTSKHHDGFALWPSKEASKAFGRPWNAMDAAAKRDLLGDLTTAVKKTDVKMGFYYSLYEWYNPLYAGKQYDKYVDEHMLPQMKELVNNYQPDIVWTDGEWDQSDTLWKSREFLTWLYNESPVKAHVAVNDRWGKGMRQQHGGYYTTEYEVGKTYDRPWEECRGMGFSFGYNRNEDVEDYNSAQSLIYLLLDIVSSGGNLLLDIGPDAHGKIPPIMQERLLQIGKWLDVNGEAIYNTRSWKEHVQWSEGRRDWKPAPGMVSGEALLKQTVDPEPGFAVKELFFTRNGSTVYAIAPQLPEGKLLIKGLQPSGRTTVSILGLNKPLAYRKVKDGIEVTVPKLSLREVPCKHAFAFKVTYIVE
ncbi:alpha-L-fucosidase [Chitinophaga sp. XS-30]|uniref:alpha-L-fucosidase n=1 Tax=Chitinophaga sp. XS-30 TaxID=2604421 RepID=UPI0011DDC4FF|nr:alpha-L-fucosidase [Chitinophaga sp. XS-30]QEH43350.1 alpha-L-fucosidase [Chitinophaga sp. XS-30]